MQALGPRGSKEACAQDPQPQDPALTTEVAEVPLGLQPSDQGVDVRVVELQAFQEGNGSVLPARLQQIQQVPLGERMVSGREFWGGFPWDAGCGGGGNPRTSRDQEVTAVFRDPWGRVPSLLFWFL